MAEWCLATDQSPQVYKSLSLAQRQAFADTAPKFWRR